jgi:hypothetical protein
VRRKPAAIQAPRAAKVGARTALCAALLSLAACAGARHRKVAGPPPEYERPDDPDPHAAGDGGGGSADGGVASEPASRPREKGVASGGGTESMLISRDGRR